jgi:Zn-finger protein
MEGSAKLTKEMIMKAVQELREWEYTPCEHCVGPYDQGWVNCALCMAPVYVKKARVSR